jgi:hypothetical protein
MEMTPKACSLSQSTYTQKHMVRFGKGYKKRGIDWSHALNAGIID